MKRIIHYSFTLRRCLFMTSILFYVPIDTVEDLVEVSAAAASGRYRYAGRVNLDETDREWRDAATIARVLLGGFVLSPTSCRFAYLDRIGLDEQGALALFDMAEDVPAGSSLVAHVLDEDGALMPVAVDVDRLLAVAERSDLDQAWRIFSTLWADARSDVMGGRIPAFDGQHDLAMATEGPDTFAAALIGEFGDPSSWRLCRHDRTVLESADGRIIATQLAAQDIDVILRVAREVAGCLEVKTSLSTEATEDAPAAMAMI